MAATLFPLLYNSGVQRDGTTFQSMYCTDAQWIRFQRDRIKKIGGMKGINLTTTITNITNLKIYPSNDAGEIITFIGHQAGLTVVNSNPDWVSIRQNVLLTTPQANPNLMWETETVVDETQPVPNQPAVKKSYIVFMATNNKTDINQNSPSTFYRKEISQALNGEAEANVMQGVDPLINGNLCFASPYLFLFGSNGFVQYSVDNNPFEFRESEGGGSFIAASDKVIFGRAIRGGPSSPSLLLWTLSSVVRVTNSGLDANNNIIFKPETISSGSSVLSSKCVVEYDGFFFWPGTDRFFVYNGIVDELPNKLNQNFFFDNIDMDRRQQVFGVKNAKYGEIWWFYPVKDVPGNSRAIVYNKRENFWYDTAISRDAGTFSNNFGFMATYGQPLTNSDNIGYLWRHEVGTMQDKGTPAGRVLEPITSSFVAPEFSWVAFPPKISKGSQPAQLINRWMDLQRIEPDFVNTDNPSHFTVTVSTKEYAQSKSQLISTTNFDSDTEKLDMRAQGRNMTLTFSSNDNFEVGQIMLLLGIGDAR